MPFDADKDVCVKEWLMNDEDDAENLLASIRQHNNGELKFQVGPRTTITKKGTVKTFKAGRLNKEEVEWLSEILQEVITGMS